MSGAVIQDLQAPHEGRLSRKELLALVSSIMALMSVAIDMMLPALGDIEEAFGRTDGGGQIITVFFFGLAFAQVVYGPLADALGRKPVLYISIGIYLLGAVICALAPSFTVMLVGRFVWGIGAAGARVVAVSIIRDRFSGVAMAKAMSQMMAIFILVPVFAPTIGAGVLLVAPWRAIFWVCVVWAVLIGLWGTRLQESLAPENVRPLNFSSTIEGYTEVARTPITFGYTMSTLFVQGVFTTYLAVSESIVDEVFGLASWFPIIFSAVAIMFGLAAVINGRIVERLGIDAVVNRTFAVNLPISVALILVSIVTGGSPPIWIYMPLLALVLASFMFLMPNLGSAAMVPVGHLAGSGSALTGAVRTAGGAFLATLVSPWAEGNTTWFAVVAMVFCVLSALCVLSVRRNNDLGVPRP